MIKKDTLLPSSLDKTCTELHCAQSILKKYIDLMRMFYCCNTQNIFPSQHIKDNKTMNYSEEMVE